MWDTHADVKRTVDDAWLSNGHDPTAAGIRAKLTTLAADFGGWSKSTFGSVRGVIKKLKRELDVLRNIPTIVGPSHAEIKMNDRLIELYLRGRNNVAPTFTCTMVI